MTKQLAIASNFSERLLATHPAAYGWGSVVIAVACLRGSNGGVALPNKFDDVSGEDLRDRWISAV